MKILENLKRIGLDLIALITIILLMIFVPVDYLPIEAKAGLLSLVITKFILVSIAIVHAHITRKLMFPYIKFAEEKELSNNAMIIVWYIIVIFGWTRGG
jgi:hypothetical protein